MKRALEFALPNSLAFVFTDAPAKDYALYDTILPIIQKKQVKVSFLATGEFKNDPNDPMQVVFHKIALASEGQVFEMSRDIVKSVLLSITQGLDNKFESLSSINSDKAGSTTAAIKVDQGFSALSVSMAGKNSKLSVKDRNNVEVKSSSELISPNIKFVTFNVADSSYTIKASADSAYSIRVGGISDLKFEFGFSTDHPSEQAETSIQPLIGYKNVLSIFVSDPTLIKCITKATLLPANTKDLFVEQEILLDRVKRDMFTSNPFEIPSKMFKIRINGYDKAGTPIERLISSGIESVKGCKMELSEFVFSSLKVYSVFQFLLISRLSTAAPK